MQEIQKDVDVMKEKAEMREVRKGILEKLKEEFNVIHLKIVDERTGRSEEDLEKLIRCQDTLAARIIREARAIGGDNAYAMPPYTLDT